MGRLESNQVKLFKARNGVETFKTATGFVFFNLEQGVKALNLKSKDAERLMNSISNSVVVKKNDVVYCSVGGFVYFVCEQIKHFKSQLSGKQFLNFVQMLYESTIEDEMLDEEVSVPELLRESIETHFVNQNSANCSIDDEHIEVENIDEVESMNETENVKFDDEHIEVENIDEVESMNETENGGDDVANSNIVNKNSKLQNEEEKMENEVVEIEKSINGEKAENLVEAQPKDEKKPKKEKRGNDKMKARFECLANYKQSEAFKQMVQKKQPSLIFEDAVAQVCEKTNLDKAQVMRKICDAKIGTRLNCFSNSALEEHKNSGYFEVERVKVQEYEFPFHFATPKGVEFLCSLVK